MAEPSREGQEMRFGVSLSVMTETLRALGVVHGEKALTVEELEFIRARLTEVEELYEHALSTSQTDGQHPIPPDDGNEAKG
jgi:hypothetical protein